MQIVEKLFVEKIELKRNVFVAQKDKELTS